MPNPLDFQLRVTTTVAFAITLMIASTSVRGDELVYRLAATSVPADNDLISAELNEQPTEQRICDRLWTISTRRLTTNPCRANLENPAFVVSRVSCCGQSTPTTFDQYIQSVGGDGRRVVVYVHGNRKEADQAIRRGLTIYRHTLGNRKNGPIDWVMLSWPADKQGFLIHDARRKADRTDAQGLYLSWILRQHAQSGIPTTLIAYSFGGRIVTGALHALAGGRLGGRIPPGPAITGMACVAGLVAPAIENHSLTSHGGHAFATKNLDRLLLYYNPRDAILKRYWLLDRVRGTIALGYSGPKAFAARADGSKLPVRSRDCSPFIGHRHIELNYYEDSCHAQTEMAALIDGIPFSN